MDKSLHNIKCNEFNTKFAYYDIEQRACVLEHTCEFCNKSHNYFYDLNSDGSQLRVNKCPLLATVDKNEPKLYMVELYLPEIIINQLKKVLTLISFDNPQNSTSYIYRMEFKNGGYEKLASHLFVIQYYLSVKSFSTQVLNQPKQVCVEKFESETDPAYPIIYMLTDSFDQVTKNMNKVY